MRYVLGLLLLVLLSLSGCDENPPESIDPPTVAPPTETATIQPVTVTVTTTPTAGATTIAATLFPVTPLATIQASPPPKAPPTSAVPTTAVPTTVPPASPTLEIGKLPPFDGSPEPEVPAEWTTYENATYGFTFSYPAERWLVVERAGETNGLSIAHIGQGIVLRMRFKAEGEDADLQLFGGAVGELVPQGTVRFIGKEVERTALVNGGITNRVFYNKTEPIPRGDLLFSFALVPTQDSATSIVLPDDVQAEADRIIESFALED